MRPNAKLPTLNIRKVLIDLTTIFLFENQSKMVKKLSLKAQKSSDFNLLDTRPNYPGSRVVKKVTNYPGTRVLDTRRWKH